MLLTRHHFAKINHENKPSQAKGCLNSPKQHRLQPTATGSPRRCGAVRCSLNDGPLATPAPSRSRLVSNPINRRLISNPSTDPYSSTLTLRTTNTIWGSSFNGVKSISQLPHFNRTCVHASAHGQPNFRASRTRLCTARSISCNKAKKPKKRNKKKTRGAP